MADEYIKRDAVLELQHLDGVGLTRWAVVNVDDIKAIPAADVAEVKHGRNLSEEWPSLFECSKCGWSCNDTMGGDTEVWNYCPNCGAKMDGGNDHAE